MPIARRIRANLTLPTIPFRRDRLQVGFDLVEGWHDMDGDADRVPIGFHAVPDTDYEFSLYGCAGRTK